MTLKENLRFLRERKGLSQAELAEKLGKVQATIQKIESGKTEIPRFIGELSEFFGVPEDELLFGDLTTVKKETSSLKTDNTNNLKDKLIGMRIIEERGRLGYSQQKLAEVTQIDINRLQSYEFGEDKIPIDFLTSIISSGIDIQYILTGQRLNSPDSSHTPQGVNITSSASNIHSGIGVINQNKIEQLEQNKKH